MIHRLKLNVLIIAGYLLFFSHIALSMDYSWEMHNDYERIVFELGHMPGYLEIRRTGTQEITFYLPDEVSGSEASTYVPDLTLSKLISDVRSEVGSFVIMTTTSAFGYIFYSLPQENKVVMDIFHDQLGLRWQPAMNVYAPTSPGPLVESSQPDSITEIEVQLPEPESRPTHKMRAVIKRVSPGGMVFMGEGKEVGDDSFDTDKLNENKRDD
jgi:hypothetical protein